MHGAPLERVEAIAYAGPTDRPEVDGTMAWDHTTLVVAEVSAGGETASADACIAAEAASDVASRTAGRAAGETTHWTAAAMAEVNGISVSSVQRI
jgi:hypothetical protein